jgi:inner membrane transporter RhtA
MHETNRALLDRRVARAPPQLWFCVSAVFHYLGPSFAVLLFPAVGVLGVAWLRIATAAFVFAPVTRPWRTLADAAMQERVLLVALGICLAAMNCAFYLALSRLPISLVACMEFVGTLAVALVGLRTRRNLAALAFAVAGVWLLVDVQWAGDRVGLAWAVLNAALFVAYIAIGHRIARQGASAGIDRLGAAMFVAFLAVFPVGVAQAIAALRHPLLLGAGVGVGICSSVIPYVCDQFAMARLPRAGFALLMALLPASATVIGALVLAQIPSLRDLAGLALVVTGVALHGTPERAGA